MVGIYSCAKDDSYTKETNQKVELRKGGWGAVLADVGGGMGGVSTGAWWGGLAGPTGAVIGGMLGGVIGCVSASVGAGRQIGDYPTYEIVPLAPVNDNSINNPYDHFGILHNNLLNKYLKGNKTGNAFYDDLYSDALIALQANSIYDLNSFNSTTFKINFSNDFSTNYNGNFIESPYFIALSQELKQSSFADNEDFEQFIRVELLKNLTNEELFGLAILRHTYYFWNS